MAQLIVVSCVPTATRIVSARARSGARRAEYRGRQEERCEAAGERDVLCHREAP
ncbi:hypothetical protein M2440_003377 [Methylorubrum extorquens]|nr:hypothetical protein [Methylorubrum extorquens]